MKRVIIATIVMATLLAGKSEAQQLPQFTQYMFNQYIVNPAVGGTHNYYQIRYNNRFQWVGLPDAPQTYNLSAYGPHGSKDMGFGGTFYYDVTGPTSRTGGLFSYSYNMQINDEGWRLSGGVSLGFLMFGMDKSKFEYGDNWDIISDPAIEGAKSVFTPDASIGVLLYTTRFIVGLSAHQLFGQKLYSSELGDEDERFYGANRLKQHFMLTGGTIIPLNQEFEIEPSVLIKYMYTGPIQVDINAKVTYNNQFWGGISGRWQDGLAIMFGYNHEDRLMFGYSFDYSLTGIRTFQGGSHEIMIGYMFDQLK